MKKKPHPRSCHKCRYLGQEDDGNYAEFSISWPACDLVERYQYLKSFPFKKRMPCFRSDLQVDEFKSSETELYAGGVWTERDQKRLLALEVSGELYR